MPALRTLAHLFLVLALLAGGLAPGAAAADALIENASGVSPCHAPSDVPADAAPADCCDDGGCACDCLHPVPAGLLTAPRLPRLAVLGVDQPPLARVLPATGAAPEIRPPIA
ncbi:hypothetical protein [Arenimonas alkanexedens]